MTIIEGDILAVSHGVICHQVNCKHVMGAGLAAAIRKNIRATMRTICPALRIWVDWCLPR